MRARRVREQGVFLCERVKASTCEEACKTLQGDGGEAAPDWVFGSLSILNGGGGRSLSVAEQASKLH